MLSLACKGAAILEINKQMMKTDNIQKGSQSEGQLYPLPQNDNGAASKFKAHWWPSIVTLTLSLHCCVMGSAYCLIEVNT